MSEFALSGQEAELSDDGFGVHAEDPSGTPLGDPGAEELSQKKIDPPFFLRETRVPGGTGEVFAAGPTEESLDGSTVGGAMEESVPNNVAGFWT